IIIIPNNNILTLSRKKYISLFDMNQLPPHLLYFLCFISALVISIVSIPQIMLVATKKRLYDTPDGDRKIHLRVIPNLGGIGIFFGFITTACLFISPEAFLKWNF